MKVAILGGGNVYALDLARHLHELGIQHFGIGRSPRKPPAFWVEHHYDYRALHLRRERTAVMAVLDTEKPDIIVNYAAQGEGQASFGAYAPLFYETNTLALVTLAEQLRSRDYLRHFVQIGTSELYGSTREPATEDAPLKPSSPYAISKAAFDLHLQTMHAVGGFPANVVRPSNCVARGQQLHRIVPKAIICALTGRRLPLHGGGTAEKSYLHATDLSRGVMAVIERGEKGLIYNCGPTDSIRIMYVVEMVAEACGVDSDTFVKVTADRAGQDSRYWLDSSRLRAIGWRPTIPLSEAISDMVAWVRSNPEILTMSTDYSVRP